MKDRAQLLNPRTGRYVKMKDWEFLGTLKFDPLPNKYYAEYNRLVREARRLNHDTDMEIGMVAFRRIFGESS